MQFSTLCLALLALALWAHPIMEAAGPQLRLATSGVVGHRSPPPLLST